MIIGVDFDNTLACYDALFHRMAIEQNLISPDTPISKTAVRDTLRAQGMEQQWINLQGLAYGRRIHEATIFPHAKCFFQTAKAANITLHIVSHKTLYPVSGDDINLHDAATKWLVLQGFLGDGDNDGLLPRSHVHFELTKAAKLARIKALACDCFIDDLPEFLGERSFPDSTEKWLFDPTGSHNEATIENMHVGCSWQAMADALIRPRTTA